MQILFMMALVLSSALVAPIDIEVTLDGDLATISWSDTNNGEDGYWLYRDGAKYRQLEADTTSYVDDVSDNRRHTYMLTAFSGDEESELSYEVNVRSTGISERVLYIGVPVIVAVILAALYLGRERKDAESPTEDELDIPITLFDRIRKF